jgi:hypothetical protein
MAKSKPETGDFYDPKATAPAANTVADPPRHKRPGPKPKSPPVDMRATAAGQPTAKSGLAAIAVDPKEDSLTADSAFVAPTDDRRALIEDVARIRAMRKPFGAFTQKLALPERPGYHRHWFSDEPGRVDEAKSNGWAHVKDKEDKPLRRVVGRGRDGGAMYGYAMELPKVFWDEDMQARNDAAQARIDEIKKSPIRSKPGQAKASDRDKFYSPSDEVLSISQTNVRSPRAS